MKLTGNKYGNLDFWMKCPLRALNEYIGIINAEVKAANERLKRRQ